jgi:hypothetical protein
MKKTSIFITLILTFVVLFAQAGNAAAAPLAQDPAPVTGIISDIALDTDVNGVTTVLVTVDNLGVIQTVRISDDAAFELGLLLTLDPPVVDTSKINTNTTVSIPAAEVIPNEAAEEEKPVHPISALLAGFFNVDASVIDGYHADGFGFGVIAQALWMSQNLTGTDDEAGDATLAGQILDAKESGDYSAFAEYFEEGSIPTNWGQFRKALADKKNNLGSVVSGQADQSDTTTQPGQGSGNGQGNGNGNNNGNGNGQGNGNGNNNGNKGNGHGNGKGNGNKP